jgi:hypothetical protein
LSRIVSVPTIDQLTHLGKSALAGLVHLVSSFSQSALRSHPALGQRARLSASEFRFFLEKSEFSGWAKVSDLAGFLDFS